MRVCRFAPKRNSSVVLLPAPANVQSSPHLLSYPVNDHRALQPTSWRSMSFKKNPTQLFVLSAHGSADCRPSLSSSRRAFPVQGAIPSRSSLQCHAIWTLRTAALRILPSSRPFAPWRSAISSPVVPWEPLLPARTARAPSRRLPPFSLKPSSASSLAARGELPVGQGDDFQRAKNAEIHDTFAAPARCKRGSAAIRIQGRRRPPPLYDRWVQVQVHLCSKFQIS
jgi:hypothetical protein